MLSFLIFLLLVLGIIVFSAILCIIIRANHMSDEQQKQEDERQMDFIRKYRENKEKH